MPKFLNIVAMAWIGIALQPLVFFATNRKFRVHACALMCCREPPEMETSGGSSRRRSTRTSSSVSRPSRISFADLRTLLGTLPQSIRDKAFIKERSPNKNNDNLQTIGEVQEPLTVSTKLWSVVVDSETTKGGRRDDGNGGKEARGAQARGAPTPPPFNAPGSGAVGWIFCCVNVTTDDDISHPAGTMVFC